MGEYSLVVLIEGMSLVTVRAEAVWNLYKAVSPDFGLVKVKPSALILNFSGLRISRPIRKR